MLTSRGCIIESGRWQGTCLAVVNEQKDTAIVSPSVLPKRRELVGLLAPAFLGYSRRRHLGNLRGDPLTLSVHHPEARSQPAPPTSQLYPALPIQQPLGPMCSEHCTEMDRPWVCTAHCPYQCWLAAKATDCQRIPPLRLTLCPVKGQAPLPMCAVNQTVCAVEKGR